MSDQAQGMPCSWRYQEQRRRLERHHYDEEDRPDHSHRRESKIDQGRLRAPDRGSVRSF